MCSYPPSASYGVTTASGFGGTLAADGDWLWVGAPGNNDGAGAVFRYRLRDASDPSRGYVPPVIAILERRRVDIRIPWALFGRGVPAQVRDEASQAWLRRCGHEVWRRHRVLRHHRCGRHVSRGHDVSEAATVSARPSHRVVSCRVGMARERLTRCQSIPWGRYRAMVDPETVLGSVAPTADPVLAGTP